MTARPQNPRQILLGCLIMAGFVAVMSIMIAFASCGAKDTKSVSPASSKAVEPSVKPDGDRGAAADTLSANVAHFRDMFDKAQKIIGRTQYKTSSDGLAALYDPSSAAAKFADFRKSSNIERDMSYQNAFREADQHFTAETEPAAIDEWRNTMGDTTGYINTWVSVATSYQIKGKTQTELDAAAGKVLSGLDKAQGLADAVRAG
jgi:hypothetical protein